MSETFRSWALGILGSLIAAMLGTYFIWLGTEVNSIGKEVAGMRVLLNEMREGRGR